MIRKRRPSIPLSMQIKGFRVIYASMTLVVVLAFLLSSCSGRTDGRTLPSANGSIYECVVVCGNEVYEPVKAVMAADMPCLPQMESYFRLTHVTSALFDDMLKGTRNVLMVDIQPDRYTQTKARYLRDAWSTPQAVCRVQTPDAEAFLDWWQQNGEQVREWFIREEMIRQVRFLRAGTNKEARQALRQRLNCDMLIPADFVVVKDSADLVWCCNNKGSMRRDIVVYRYPYTQTSQLTPDSIYAKRDEVMGRLVTASVPGSYMGTEYRIFPPQCRQIEALEKDSTHSFYGYEVRGLWKILNGEAMGGPYVSHTRLDLKRGYVVTAEVFLYAAGQKKRNALRQTEAILYTLSIAE